MKHYMKIIGKVDPCILMNTIANKIKKRYGDPQAFMMAVNNNYSKLRKTSLREMIIKSYE